MLPEFTPDQHVSEVYDKLVESIQSMKRPAKYQLLNKMVKALRSLLTNTMTTYVQRVGTPPTSEGGCPTQRVVNAPPVTPSTNPTAP